jgi:tight adherence protein B
LEVFGIRTDEAEMHRLPWGWALVAGLALARVVAGLMAAPLGEAALLLVPVIWVLLVRSFFQWCRTRHMALLYQQFPDALGMIVRSVRVGVTVAEALRTVAREAPFPTSIAFARLADRVSIGVALDEALRVMADRSGLPEYRFFATALSLQSQTGGALTETLENLADVIRRRVGLRKRAFALASEARTSALILTALPIVTGTALLIISPGYIAPLFYEPAGQKMLGAAVLSLSAGTLVMRAIISRSLS